MRSPKTLRSARIMLTENGWLLGSDDANRCFPDQWVFRSAAEMGDWMKKQLSSTLAEAEKEAARKASDP